jgi:drug/metabolite transporter (DMT)-like permease
MAEGVAALGGRIARRWERLPAGTRGIVWMLLSGFGFTLSAVFVKTLGARYDSLQIVFLRMLVSLLIILPIIWPDREAVLRSPHRVFHVGRSLCGILATFAGIYAVTVLPLAEVTALTFTQPLFALVLAVLILKEPVGWRRWTATAVGFAGVIVMMRPGQAALQPASGAALATAFLIATAVILVKKLPASERPSTMLFYFGTAGSLIAVGPAISVWRWPEPLDWVLFVLVGTLSMAAQSFIIRAFRIGRAASVAPFDYVRLIYATALGYFVFAEVPDGWTYAGAALIVATTLYIGRREARLRAAAER